MSKFLQRLPTLAEEMSVRMAELLPIAFEKQPLAKSARNGGKYAWFELRAGREIGHSATSSRLPWRRHHRYHRPVRQLAVEKFGWLLTEQPASSPAGQWPMRFISLARAKQSSSRLGETEPRANRAFERSDGLLE